MASMAALFVNRTEALKIRVVRERTSPGDNHRTAARDRTQYVLQATVRPVDRPRQPYRVLLDLLGPDDLRWQIRQAWLTGYIADLPTPFEKDAELDLDAFAALCEPPDQWPALRLSSSAKTARRGTDVDDGPKGSASFVAPSITAQGRARIIAGAGSNSTDRAIELTRQAETRRRLTPCLSVGPYYKQADAGGDGRAFSRAVVASHRSSRSSSTTFLHGPSASWLTRRWRGWAESAQFIGLRDGAGDVVRPVRLRSRLSTALPPADGR